MKFHGAILTGLFVVWPATSAATEFDAIVARHANEIIELRHHIHSNPELGNRETDTSALVASHLRELGFDSVETNVAHTGVIGVLNGGKSGPVVAVRADMDALPVKEQTGFEFASTKTAMWEGREVPVMHACGHDVHTSVLMGVASVMSELREEIPGSIKFIFQPAEEGPPAGEEGGAALMVEEGVLQGPAAPGAVFALHALPDLEAGQVGYTAGPAFAAVDHFYITLTGRQSHGARPHEGVDPIVMGSQAVSAFQTIRSRTLDPLEPSVVTVGMFHGGGRFNIIPEEVALEGTVRTYSEQVRATVERRMREILDGTSRAAGGSFEMRYDHVTPATINDPVLTSRVVPALVLAVGEENVFQLEPTMGGEDFAFFSREVPGFYFRLGTRAPGGESGGLHTPTFKAVDEAVPVGIRAMSSVIMAYLTIAMPRP